VGVLITACLGGGRLTLQNREIEFIEITSKLGEPHRCILRFDLDTSHDDVLHDFHGPLTVEIADDSILGDAKAVLFDGVMTGGTQDHQLRGGSRFEVQGASPLLLGMERRQSATFRPTSWDEAAGALNLHVVDPPRFGVPANGYRMYGESRLEFVRRMADDAGFAVIERDGEVQLRSQFDDSRRRDLVWGAQLLALRARSHLVNHRFRGGIYEQQSKADYRFRDQRKEPVVTGALKLCEAMKEAAPTFANPDDPNLVMTDSRTATRALFRDSLQRESERALGAAVVVEGESRDFMVRLGETVQLMEAPGFPLPMSGGVYGIIEVVHRWNAAEYRNEFIGSPWQHFSNAERPPLRTTPGPCLAEVLQTPPEILQRGYLFVRPAYVDRNDDYFIATRLVSPFTGHQRGIVFVPEPGDEVLVGFAQGDPEHAYLLGSLWNGKDDCPGIEPKQIVTKNGNVLALHDDGWIELYTPSGKCMLQMSSTDKGDPRVMLHSEGDLLLEAKGQIQLRAASLHEEISGGAVRDIGGDEKHTVGGGIEEKVSGIMKVDASRGMEQKAGGAKLVMDPTGARLSSVNTIIEGKGVAVVTGAVVQLNPPVVPPEVPLVAPPARLPGALKTSWEERKVPEATPPFSTDQDPAPSGNASAGPSTGPSAGPAKGSAG
jgi:uncharacterized protein involved in type VI secretion and phage assembly